MLLMQPDFMLMLQVLALAHLSDYNARATSKSKKLVLQQISRTGIGTGGWGCERAHDIPACYTHWTPRVTLR